MGSQDNTTIGGYRVVRQLGRGGMASVFEVEHPTLGVHLALKVFDAEGERAEFLRSRLLAEGRVLARLEHPNLVKVHDCGVDEATGAAYITMDLVLSADGEPRTLSDLHAKHEIDEELLFRWYADIASALDYIHSRGIVHRDVKPSNILIAADGRAVLADFGVSRFCDEGLRQELSVEPTMVTDASSAKVILGTMNYIAPEVKRGEEATEKSDLYSLGVSLFRILTGIWYEPETGAMNLLDTYDPSWKAIFTALLDDDPARRSMPPRRRPRRVWLVAAVVAGALAIAAAVALVLRNGSKEPEAGRSGESRESGESGETGSPGKSGTSGESGNSRKSDRSVDDLFFVPK